MSDAVSPRPVSLPGSLAAAVIVCLLGAAVTLAIIRDARYGDRGTSSAMLYVPSAAAVARISLSWDALMADVYWIRAIQHYGGNRLSDAGDKQYPLLYPLLDITTTLDPRFVVAYRFGAIFLAESPPGGPGRPDQAIALLQKGLAAEPGKWQYMQDIGFVCYWWLHDYRRAAEWFERASGLPDAPWYLRSLAAVTLNEGGDRDRSRLLWQKLRETADNEWLRGNAELRLRQLDALDAIDWLAARVREFQAGTGRTPESWEVLIRAGLLGAVPVDPAGVPYVLDARRATVSVSETSPLYPLPAEPQARPTGPPDA